MKLALVRRRFAATGGAELYLQRLLRCLSEAGHELHLFCESWRQTPDGVTVHPVPVRGKRARRPAAFAQALDHALSRDSFDCVFSMERTLRQDVYRAGDGVHRMWLARRRTFATWWRRPWIGLGRFHQTVMQLEERTFDRTATRRVIVNSDMVRREIVRCFSFPEDRIHLVRNGVDVDRIRTGDRETGRRQYSIRDNERVILFAGSGWERKGLKYLLNAMKALSLRNAGPVRLLVAGRGRPPLAPPESVTFCGPVPEMKHLYAAADLFVFLPIYEPSANVCAEALACGLPVVTTRFNGASEWIVPPVNGSILDDPRDTASVCDEIQHWLRRMPFKATPDLNALRLERNVKETVDVLEWAAREAKESGSQ